MPGPVSDSFDPEFGTGENCQLIRDELNGAYKAVSGILGNRDPIYVLDLVNSDLPTEIEAKLTEKHWRIIRFALERAGDSI